MHAMPNDAHMPLGRPGRFSPQDTPPDPPETLGQLLTRVLRLVEHQTTVLDDVCARLDAVEHRLRDRRT
jgi:hypothetical protein